MLLAVSAFMSSSEIALFSLSRFQLRLLRERFRHAHRKIKRLLADPAGLLITILIINEIVNITLSSLITSAISRNWNDWQDAIKSLRLQGLLSAPDWALQTLAGIVVTTPIVLFFGEITPKAVAVRANNIVAPMNVGILSLVYDLMKPVRLVLNTLVTYAARKAGRDRPGPDIHTSIREDEFLSLVEEGHKEGTIGQSELELIRNVFEMDDRTVLEAHTPLGKLYMLPPDTTLKNAIAAMRGKRYSRIPVLGPGRRNITGILYSKDFMLAQLSPEVLEQPVSALMRKPFTVPHTMMLNALFRKMKQHKTHMAVVEKSPGETLGIITLNDVIETLFEDVIPEPEEGPPVPAAQKTTGGRPA